jgi:hypothetical protein
MTAEANLQNETTAEKKKRLTAEKKEKEAATKKAAELEKKKQKQKEIEEKEVEEKAYLDAKAAFEQATRLKEKRVEKERAAKEKRQRSKKTTLKDLTEDYNLKKINGLFVPGYFHRTKRYADNAEEKVDVYHAHNFLFGMEIFEEQGSCSAKFTYVGPNRRYTMRNVKLGKREARPAHNNWKIFNSAVRMFKTEGEHNAKIKDPKIIRDVLTSQGGKANFKVRFVQDKAFTQEEVKKKVYAKDPVRLRNLNYRIKKDQAKLGIKPTLRDKGEALLLISDLRKEVKDKKANHVIDYLQKEVSKYEEIEKKQKAEAKKD